MTVVAFWRDNQGRITAFAALGHAGYGSADADIVCAALSALTQCTVNAVERVCRLPMRVISRPGLLWARMPQAAGKPHKRRSRVRWHDAQVLLSALASAVEDLAQAYPAHVALVWLGAAPGWAGDDNTAKRGAFHASD